MVNQKSSVSQQPTKRADKVPARKPASNTVKKTEAGVKKEAKHSPASKTAKTKKQVGQIKGGTLSAKVNNIKKKEQNKNASPASTKKEISKKSSEASSLKALKDNLFGKKPIKKDSTKKTKKAKNKDKDMNFTQDLIPVKNIKDGIIHTSGGAYIRIMEVIPINYYSLRASDKKMVIKEFGNMFTTCPAWIKFKTVTDHIPTDDIVKNIKKANIGVTDKNFRVAMEDYIRYCRNLGRTSGLLRRYFIIFKFTGSEDSNGNKYSDIVNQLNISYYSIKTALEGAGHFVPTHLNEDLFLAETLYDHYNKNTKHTEPYLERSARIWTDYENYYRSAGMSTDKIRVEVPDLISPKGMNFTLNSDYCLVDGLYYTFISLQGNKWPASVEAGWLDFFNSHGIGVDIDVIAKKQPHDIMLYKADKYASLKRIKARENVNKPGKYYEISGQAANAQTIANYIRSGEDVFDCLLVITIWGKDPERIMTTRSEIIAEMKNAKLGADKSHYDCISYYKTTDMLMSVAPDIFSRGAHNLTTSMMSSIYNFTTFQLIDGQGQALGVNTQSGSLIANNRFNTSMYNNANLLIIGGSGAGKSFTEMVFGSRERLTGINTYYILPVKGHEYKGMCERLDGTFASLGPGSDNCINLLEIRPEKRNYQESEDDTDSRKLSKQSLRAKKITSISTWLQLIQRRGDTPLNSRELNSVNTALVELYEDFEITDDNNSIYNNDGEIKRMPILSNLYDKLKNFSELERLLSTLEPWVKGSCRNMNGLTNIDLEKKCIVFDVDESMIGKELLPGFMYIAFDCCYELTKANTNGYSDIILDEVWKMLQNPACAEQVQDLSKLIRGYGGAVTIATQEIKDFLESSHGFGSSVINNTKIKFIMGMEKEDLIRLDKILDLRESDKGSILHFSRGQGLLMTNRNQIPLQVVASDLETYYFTTDLSVKKRLGPKLRAAGMID